MTILPKFKTRFLYLVSFAFSIYLSCICIIEAKIAEKGNKKEVSRLIQTVSTKTFKFAQEKCDITWMSVDVSNNGSTLVFDALGDIYTIPSAGGEATRITRWPAEKVSDVMFKGKPFSSQPAISPDGKRIAFISDRSGIENIWIINIDGSAPKQVSFEKSIRLASPEWTADGQGIVVRRGKDRWGSLFHYIVDDPTSAGQPVFSRISSEHRPVDIQGPALGANGDMLFAAPINPPNGRPLRREHWQIFRFSSIQQTIEQATEFDGGAVRPVESSQGTWLAFAAWKNQEPVIILQSKDTKASHVIENVERNTQDSFISQMDLFPGYAFSSDEKFLYLSIDGTPARYDIASGKTEAIPCSINTQFKIAQPYTPEIKVNIQNTSVRAIRWPQKMPNEKGIIAEFAGSIWQLSFDKNYLVKPVILSSKNVRSAQPALSPDGKKLAYVELVNGSAGKIVEYNLQTKNQRYVTDESIYLAPRYLPDGNAIVMLKETKTSRALQPRNRPREIVVKDGQTPLRTLGSYTMGDEGVFVYTKQGSPSIMFVGDKQLLSTNLDNGHSVVIAESTNIDAVVPNPNGSKFAVMQLTKVDVVSEDDLVTLLTLPRQKHPSYMRSLPSGSFPTWWKDDELIWAFGSNIVQRGENAEMLQYSSQFTVPSYINNIDTNNQSVVYENARIITISEKGVIEKGSIVVKSGRITDIGPTQKLEIPANAVRIDLSKKTIIPGLIDVHQHALTQLGQDPVSTPPKIFSAYQALLAFGITSTREPAVGSDVLASSAIDLVDTGFYQGPRVFTSGVPIIYPEFTFMTQDDAEKVIADRVALGATVIKEYLQPARKHRQWVLSATRSNNITATFEGGYDYKNSLTAVLDGFSGVEHSAGNIKLRSDATDLIVASKIHVTPTIMTQIGASRFFRRSDITKHSMLTKYFPSTFLKGLTTRELRGQDVPDAETAYGVLTNNAATLIRKGATVGIGAHDRPAPTGLGTHWEIQSFVDGGLSPLEAISAATLGGAKIIGIDKDLGSLELGKIADFVILSQNPLDNIQSTQMIDGVVLNGQLVNERKQTK